MILLFGAGLCAYRFPLAVLRDLRNVVRIFAARSCREPLLQRGLYHRGELWMFPGDFSDKLVQFVALIVVPHVMGIGDSIPDHPRNLSPGASCWERRYS